jgi:hypothetical protein
MKNGISDEHRKKGPGYGNGPFLRFDELEEQYKQKACAQQKT